MRFWRTLAGIGAVGVAGYEVSRRFQGWIDEKTRAASADSHIAFTARGQVEYDLRGTGEIVLHFHGGNVGHSGAFLFDHLTNDFTILTPDRPGYLGTPLAENGSPAAQADLFAALLDTLDIPSVAVIGVSAGGPGAIQFAARYPERTKCLVLLSAVTKKTPLSDDQLNSGLGRLVMTPRGQNVAYFLINQSMKRMPEMALREYATTQTTYGPEESMRYVQMILADPQQRRQVEALADAIVPALPRFDGVKNDLDVQQTLEPLPLDQLTVPALIVHSRNDGDIPYENATHAAEQIPNVELISVDQFGHFIWWGDADVTRDFQGRVADFLHEHS